MAVWENIFTGKFVNAAGKTVTKTVKSVNKSNTQQKKELIDAMKKKGFKYLQGSLTNHQR